MGTRGSRTCEYVRGAMLLLDLKREQLQEIAAQLEQAIYNHQVWYNSLLRTLICRLSPDQHDMADDSYRQCRLGQWYYNDAPPTLHEHPGFVAMGDEHQRMHQLASDLFRAQLAKNTISMFDYDHFASTVERVRLEMFTLKRECEDLLYNRDPLTGTINRVNMLSILREQQELARRQVQSCCLAMMDLDNFKKINDLHGHSAGDLILAAVTRFTFERLRPYDKIFRYGGEEFLICLQHMELSQAFELVESLRKELADMSIDIGHNKSMRTTASFGVTFLDPHAPVEESIDRCDKALYAAKAANRNCSKLWEPGAFEPVGR